MIERELSSIIWVNRFNESSFKEFYKDFVRLERDPTISIITIVIDSFGGDAYSMIAMRDLMKTSTKQVSTIVMGKAMSCGAFLAAAGSKGLRFCSPNSTIMIHEVSAGTYGKVEEMIHEIKDITRLNRQVFVNLAQDIGMPYATLMKKVKENNNLDLILTAEQAKVMKVIDKVDVPRLMTQHPLDVLVTMTQAPLKAKGKKK